MATATTYRSKTTHLFNSFWCCYGPILALLLSCFANGARLLGCAIDKLSVVIAIILGVVLLGEPLSMKLVMGSLLILSGVLVLAL